MIDLILNVTEVEEYADLVVQIRDLEAEVKRLKRERDQREEAVLEALAGAGLDRVATKIGTVYMRRQLWAGAPEIVDPDTGEVVGRDYERANEALRAHGLGDLIEEKFNVQRLSAIIREMDEIPPTLAENLKITEVVKAGVRRAR